MPEALCPKLSFPIDCWSLISFLLKWKYSILGWFRLFYFKSLQFKLFSPNQILTFKKMSKGYILWPVLFRWLGRNSIEICWKRLWKFFEMSLKTKNKTKQNKISTCIILVFQETPSDDNIEWRQSTCMCNRLTTMVWLSPSGQWL